MKRAFLGFLITTAIAVSATTALAQVEEPSQVSIQGTGLFTKRSTDRTPGHDATDSGGFLVGYSYQFSRWFGAEANYGWTRNTQNYLTLGGTPALQADFHEITGALVAHIPANVRHLRPYVLGGAEPWFSIPRASSSSAERNGKLAARSFMVEALTSMSPGTSAFVRNIAALFIRCRTLISTVSISISSLIWHNLPLDFTSASNSSRSAAKRRQGLAAENHFQTGRRQRW